ncbi:hypothetical protein Golax_019559 [Gossypium laxum]|uniref:Uncharacterized protein n=1 Tax=Gossypium laxum TaxID=34288 RepID=A0A7J8Z7E6_9ROSI|nr:hypothetical protein [Gossypium laxum]
MCSFHCNTPKLGNINDDSDNDSEYECDGYFGDEDYEENEQEEVVDFYFNNKSINSIIISFL